MSDPGKYRTKEALAAEKASDPIPRLGSSLSEQGWVSEEELKAMDKEIKQEMKQALQEAEAAAWPDASLIDRYVHSQPID